MESLVQEETAAQRMRREMESGQYDWRNDIEDLQRRADQNVETTRQQQRDRLNRRGENYAHLKPLMRLLRTIDEVLHLIDQVKIHQLGQGVSGLERLSDAAEFLVDHVEGIDEHIVRGISRCFTRFEDSNLLDAKERYLHHENEHNELLRTQPTHTVK